MAMAMKTRLSNALLRLLPFMAIIISALFFIHANSAAAAGEFECEDVGVDKCAFAVSSQGERCVLETNIQKDGAIHLECQASKITTGAFSSWIEDDTCIGSCGLTRMSIGLSTDFLGEYELQQSICSRSCMEACPNIVELFTELAHAEGVDLQSLCSARRFSARKLVQGSSWNSASAPLDVGFAQSPTTLPSF